MENKILDSYKAAQEVYAEIGVNTQRAIDLLKEISISIHCWQGDDVTGFEGGDTGLTGGIQATGNYPGKARNADELRRDASFVMSLIAGKHKFNLHAIYGETNGKKVERDEILPEHFSGWVDWAKEKGIGLDFNPTYFSHKLSADGFTLSHHAKGIQKFWIEHTKRCREIGNYLGKSLGKTCINNIWIPDGCKDSPIDRYMPRKRLEEALDESLSIKYDPRFLKDAVESKLFGIGSESYVVGSHEFYLSYALKNNVMLCMDAGHYHPTETVSNKISAVFCFLDEILLHVSRPVRWDSDHVVAFDDELRALMQEITRNDFTKKTNIALDFFDASINRIAAWVIGIRNAQKAILYSLLEPVEKLKAIELSGDLTGRLALTEDLKFFPVGAVWDYFCHISEIPVRNLWMDDVKKYENNVLADR